MNEQPGRETDSGIPDWYGDALQHLSPKARLVFSAFCAQRALRLWDRPDTEHILKEALDLAWAIADDREVEAATIDRVSEELTAIIPDSADEPERLCQHYVGCAIGCALHSYRNPLSADEAIGNALDAIRHAQDPALPFPSGLSPEEWPSALRKEFHVHQLALDRLKKAPESLIGCDLLKGLLVE